jgi:hypothetical protein
MAYFYDAKADVFYNDKVNNITENMIEVSEDDFIRLIDARNRGCLLFINNTGQIEATTERPTPSHEWNGKAWIISTEKQEAIFIKEKEALLNRLADKADEIKTNLLVGYPQTEIESFYRQEKEALAWKADKNADTPMLKQVARVRGVPFEVLVEKVIEKASQFAVAIGVIIGKRQAFEDRLLATKTIEELTALEKEIEEWKFQAN